MTHLARRLLLAAPFDSPGVFWIDSTPAYWSQSVASALRGDRGHGPTHRRLQENSASVTDGSFLRLRRERARDAACPAEPPRLRGVTCTRNNRSPWFC